eukprot:Colp12_sorted_trinity150504_noHs@34942
MSCDADTSFSFSSSCNPSDVMQASLLNLRKFFLSFFLVSVKTTSAKLDLIAVAPSASSFFSSGSTPICSRTCNAALAICCTLWATALNRSSPVTLFSSFSSRPIASSFGSSSLIAESLLAPCIPFAPDGFSFFSSSESELFSKVSIDRAALVLSSGHASVLTIDRLLNLELEPVRGVVGWLTLLNLSSVGSSTSMGTCGFTGVEPSLGRRSKRGDFGIFDCAFNGRDPRLLARYPGFGVIGTTGWDDCRAMVPLDSALSTSFEETTVSLNSSLRTPSVFDFDSPMRLERVRLLRLSVLADSLAKAEIFSALSACSFSIITNLSLVSEFALPLLDLGVVGSGSVFNWSPLGILVTRRGELLADDDPGRPPLGLI